jgi:hypothetical protein
MGPIDLLFVGILGAISAVSLLALPAIAGRRRRRARAARESVTVHLREDQWIDHTDGSTS